MADAETGPRPETPGRAPATPTLHLDGFDGPLDLLLDLAERHRIDLRTLSVAALVEQFVAGLSRHDHVAIERRADWLVLASRLLALRSRLLLAADPAAARAAEQAAAREVERLRDLRFVRAAAAWLEARPSLGHDVFARPRRGADPRVASYMHLMEACLTLLEREEQAVPFGAQDPAEAAYRPTTHTLFRAADALARIRTILATCAAPAPLPALLPSVPADGPDPALQARSAVTSTLIATLELARNGEAILSGEDQFEAAQLEARNPPGRNQPTVQAAHDQE